MSNELDHTISEYLEYLRQRCPKFCPSIFPSYCNPSTIENIFMKSSHKKAVEKWIHSNDFEFSNFSFSTVLNFDKHEIKITSIKVSESAFIHLFISSF